MVERDKVLVGQSRVVEIGIWVYVVKRWLPYFFDCDDDIPKAGQTVDVDDNHKDQFEQLESVFHVLSDVHALNNSTQTADTDQFEEREELKYWWGGLSKDGGDVIKG